MLTFIIRRLITAVFAVMAISVLAFVIIQLPPGDYLHAWISQLEASGETIDQETIANLRAEYGLDQPMYVQYAKWAWNMLHGNFGTSLLYRRPVTDLIGERLLLTIVVAASSITLTWVLAIPIGIYSAVRQHSLGDYCFTFLGFMGLAVPDFLLALVLMYLAYTFLDSSIGGLFSPEYLEKPWSVGRFVDLLKHLWIPAIILGARGTAALIRILRATLLDELRKPYVVTARAKGLEETRVILKYPVRVALNPLVSTVGYLLPATISGGVIVSVVLSLPTVGPLLLQSLLSQDMYLAGAIVLLLGTLTVIGTLLSDILLGILDPRIRFEK